jgi:hypothetical protein
LNPSHREEVEALRQTIKRLPRGPNRPQQAGNIANAWIDKNLSENELHQLDLFRFENAVEQYGAFIFENDEACTIASIRGSDKVRAKLRAMRLDVIETMETLSADLHMELLSSLLEESSYAKLKDIVSEGREFHEHLRPTLTRAIGVKSMTFVQWLEVRHQNVPAVLQILEKARQEFRLSNGFPAGQLDKIRKHMSPEDYRRFYLSAARRIEDNRGKMEEDILRQLAAALSEDELRKLKDDYIRHAIAFYGCLVLEARWVQNHLGAEIDIDELRKQRSAQIEELTSQLVENVNHAQTTAGQEIYAGKSLLEHIEHTLGESTDRD